jgi:hypothetical protein
VGSGTKLAQCYCSGSIGARPQTLPTSHCVLSVFSVAGLSHDAVSFKEFKELYKVLKTLLSVKTLMPHKDGSNK